MGGAALTRLLSVRAFITAPWRSLPGYAFARRPFGYPSSFLLVSSSLAPRQLLPLLIPAMVPSPVTTNSEPTACAPPLALPSAMPPPTDPYARAAGPSSGNMPVVARTLPLPGQHLDHRAQRDYRPNRQDREPPLSVLEYQRLATQYLDAVRFGRIPSVRTNAELSVRNPKRTDEEAWRARWAHLPIPRGVYPARTFGRCDMPFVRCPEEVDYQSRLQRLLKRMQDDPYFPASGRHNLLELIMFEALLDELYWLRRSLWGDNAATEARIRSSLGYFYCWHNVEFHDLAPSDRIGAYMPIPTGWKDYDVSRNLSVPTPPILVYHTTEVLNSGPFSDRVFQIVYAEWALFSFMAFLQAAINGVSVYTRDRDARLYEMDEGPHYGRLLPLPLGLVDLIRGMGLQNILRGSRIPTAGAERALRLSVETDWSSTPGFLWYDFFTGEFPTMPASGNSGPISRQELPAGRRPEWKEVTVSNYFPSGYLESDFRAAPKPISRGPVAIGQAPPPTSVPVAPLGSTGFRSVPYPTTPSVPAPIRQRVERGSQTDEPWLTPAIEEAFDALCTVCESFGESKPESVEAALLSARTWIRRVHTGGQMMRRTAEEQMRLLESIRVHSVRSLELYGHLLMEAEAYDPEMASNNPATLAVAVALARPEGTAGPPTGGAPTLDDLTLRMEGERIASQAITDLYKESHGGRGAPSAVAPAVVNEVVDLYEDEPMPQAPASGPPSGPPSVVVSEPATVWSASSREGSLPPIPRRSARAQTPGRGRGRGR